MFSKNSRSGFSYLVSSHQLVHRWFGSCSSLSREKDNIVSLTLGKQAQSWSGSKLQWVGVVVPSADPKNSQTWNIGVQKDPMLHQCSDRILCWLRILELTSYIF